MKTILLIEDNPDFLETCSDILELSGYKVIRAKDGQSGIGYALSSNPPDLILCDIIMPNLDGYGVYAVLANNLATAKIPFIFLSAKAEYGDMRKAMEMGADDYILKPFSADQLIRAIQTRLSKAEQQHRGVQPNSKAEKGSIPLGQGLQQLQQLIEQSKQRIIKKKQTLFYEGDHPQGLYLLAEGYVKTIKLTRDGRQLITGLYKPNDYIGLDALLLDGPFTESAEAIQDSKVYLLPKAMVVDVLDRYPGLSQHFIKILSSDIQEKEQQLVEIAYESVRKRLAQVLLRLTKIIQTPQLGVSREELAGLAGISTETVSRVLTDFRDEGLIEKYNGNIQVIDLQRLSMMKS